MLRMVVCLYVLLCAPILAEAQSYTLEIVDVSGGAVIRSSQSQCGASVRVQPTSTVTIVIQILDGTQPVPGIKISTFGFISYPSDGGHIHSGTGYGTLSPESRVTDFAGSAAFTYAVGRGAQTVYPYFELEYGNDVWFDTTCNPARIAEQDEDYTYLGSGNFILIGSTTSHPSNHYGQAGFVGKLQELALAYGNEWNLNLAYNDTSLIWGGVFDLHANYLGPHHEHNIGLSQDVRANGGASSVPFDSEIRSWFVQKVEDLFGQAPLHESSGTTNEHYHIRG